MGNKVSAGFAFLENDATGDPTGLRRARDGKTFTLLAGATADTLIAPGLLSGVVYDTSNRAVEWVIDGVTYTASYSSSEIVVAGSDGTIRRIALDPAQRIAGVTIE